MSPAAATAAAAAAAATVADAFLVAVRRRNDGGAPPPVERNAMCQWHLCTPAQLCLLPMCGGQHYALRC
jgi:hypothetical protein